MIGSGLDWKRLALTREKSGMLFAATIVAIALFGQTVAGQQNGEPSWSKQMTNKHISNLGDQQRQASSSDNNTTIANNDNSIKVQYVNEINGLPVLVQFTYVGPPKILPIATADSYPEGATINLICTVSGGQRKGLALNWEKDGQELNDESLRFSNDYGVSIEKTGTDISILRISNATHDDSGRYMCKAKNPIGEDSTSAQLVINVELKWNKLPADTEVGLGKDVSIECDATSQPQPIIQWTRLPSSTIKGLNDFNKSVVVSQGKYLKISRAQHKDSGLYECTARNGADSLRRVIQLIVRVVPARFAEKFTVVQAKSGESAKLECNATGDQPLSVNWFRDDKSLDKRGGENFEIYETMTNGGINSVLVIRTVNRGDGGNYKCTGSNEYGNDERAIKLLVLEVPLRPMNVRVKDAWSRSASIIWSSSFAGNSPITNYIIQYWRKNSNEAGQSAQNHRRQEFTVSGTQTSALITNLMPALTYEVSVIAENQIGRSEPSENIQLSTGEDEPTSAPSDVNVEARGPSTIRVAWKVPPSDTWNGKLMGFYIGFRPRGTMNTIDVNQMSGSASGAFSYRTVDYVKGQQVFETFLTNLMKGHEYEVVVKAFNSVGSGPESHLMAVKTFQGDLPASPSLFAHQVTHSSISLRWTYPSRAQSASNPIKRYVLYYQRQGDDSWLEIGIPVEERMRALNHNSQEVINGQTGYSVSESGTTSYLLSSLDSGSTYKIYVVAVNQFGSGDPSNLVTTKTEQIQGINDNLRAGGSHSAEMNVFEMNKQFQLFLVVPVVCTVIMVVVIVSAVLYCSRRMQAQAPQHVVTSQQQPAQGTTGTWGQDGSMPIGQRYVELDKGGILKNNNLLFTGTQSSDHNSSGHPGNQGHYPLPYGTMPMNSVVISDQKSWDRQSSAPLKPLVTHIYDSPI